MTKLCHQHATKNRLNTQYIQETHRYRVQTWLW